VADASLINNPWFAIGSSLVSGALAVVVSTLYYRHFEHRKLKVDCLRRLLGARYVLAPGQHSEGARETFFIALNEAVVIFSDAPAVIAALKTMLADIKSNDRLLDNITTLFRAMVDHLKLDRTTLNDSYFLSPFTPGKQPGLAQGLHGQ
jgi:hypothetical protein